MLVDTHCHLGDTRFDADRVEVVARARAANVGHIVIVADSAPSTEQVITLAHAFELSATAGVHPHQAASWTAETAAQIEEALHDPAVVAVGETGLDYYYDHAPRDAQRRAFSTQLALAARHGLPAVVHSRSADADTAAMLRDTPATVVLHSFSAGPQVLEVALQRGHYVSFSGMVTFRSWTDVDAVIRVPDERLLVETDAPYLAPVPYRGQRNEPAYVTSVATRVAQLRGVPVDRLAAQTSVNAARCFGARITPPVDS